MSRVQVKQTETDRFVEFIQKYMGKHPDKTGWPLYEELKSRIYKYRISYETGIKIILNKTGL